MKASEIEGVLTLEQLKAMDGQRVLIPAPFGGEFGFMWGMFGTVDAKNECVVVERPEGGTWPFELYGECWFALKG